MIAEVRGSGLMIGIELCAPRSRSARLTYRLIQRASEGLFPQLIVIPLHRDHGVITMAAGKNDVIKLLPSFRLTEDDADRFLLAFMLRSQTVSDLRGRTGQWCATSRSQRSLAARIRRAGERRGNRSMPGHRRLGVHRVARRAAARQPRLPSPLPGAANQRHVNARGARP